MKLDAGEKVTVLSDAEPGHATNAFPFYVYCKNTEGDRGWAPQLLLHRHGYGAFGVITGLNQKSDLNGTIVRVHGLQANGRVVVEHADRRLFAPELAKVHIFDFEEDFAMLQQKGKDAIRFVHPDKFGCPESFKLLMMIINTCKVTARARNNL